MCGSNRLSLPGKGLGGAPGPGGWAPRALGGLQVKRLVGQAPQLGDPWKACQRGGLLCVTPSPQGDPFAWGTCEGGGSPPDPPSRAPGGTRDWGTAAQSRQDPASHPGTPGRSALSPGSGRGVFWDRPPWSWPLFLAPSRAGWESGRPRRACPPCLTPVQHVSTLQPPGCPAVTGRAAPAQVPPGQWGVGTPGVQPSPGPLSAPKGRGGGSRPQPAPSQSIWEGHLQTDSLSHGLAGAGRQWQSGQRLDACSAGVAGCGWTCWPSSPRGGRSGWGGALETLSPRLPLPPSCRGLSWPGLPGTPGCRAVWGGLCPPYPGWSLL